jgi:hypothetical protein
MKKYRCGVCATGDDTLFTVCNHPMCPDGRDQPVKRRNVPPNPYLIMMVASTIMLVASIILLLAKPYV